nr:MAG TPA: Major capsid protein [Bacteriophage sp.]
MIITCRHTIYQMAIQKSIGKNTIGDNNKMSVSLHDYNMSTHDLSTIVRNTQSPGTLVPNLCIVAQKGDTFDIDIDSNVLTHPTTGPLFGSFKLEHHVYTGPVRLYNSWLHNNRTKIGLNMEQVKLPQIKVNIKTLSDTPSNDEKQWIQVNPSCLLAYLGIRGYANTPNSGEKTVSKNALPILTYFDIFKNYYANTQEENFYMIGASPQLTTTINGINITNPDNITTTEGAVNSSGIVTILPTTLKENEIKFRVKTSLNAREQTLSASQLGDIEVVSNKWNLTTNLIPSGQTWYITAVYSTTRTSLESYPLENLDIIRDKILMTPGDMIFDISNESMSVAPFTNFAKRTKEGNLNTINTQYGLCLKTYNSDLYQNWINTEWIEGVNGINEASAVDVADGILSMDALNLAQKVYNFLNRIAVSGGTYRDWLETVYTGGNYMERCETPMFEGGVSQEIVFQEVISNSASQDEPLGTLAGRGITTGRQKGGHIRIKVTEPCYIMCICSITPRIDYGQGNTWDTYLETMNDWHKPALDGIGYQDSLNGERAWWTDYLSEGPLVGKTAAGKTVAWINYMTNVNRTFGNFAPGMPESFMVLNRNYSMATNGQIEDLTTYIDPVKFNYIFADTNLDALNFWVQTKFDIKVRRLISAKQIPNL